MNNLNTLSSNEDIKNKIIFLRVDFNIPIKDGEVIETGTHKELLNLKGFYYELYTNQFVKE